MEGERLEVDLATFRLQIGYQNPLSNFRAALKQTAGTDIIPDYDLELVEGEAPAQGEAGGGRGRRAGQRGHHSPCGCAAQCRRSRSRIGGRITVSWRPDRARRPCLIPTRKHEWNGQLLLESTNYSAFECWILLAILPPKRRRRAGACEKAAVTT